MLHLIWIVNIHTRDFLHWHIPTSIMLNAIRERRGTKLCTPAMFLVVPDHAAGSIIMFLIGRGTAECFHLLMLLCIRNTFRVIGQNVLVEG